jgi:hypothetical protein
LISFLQKGLQYVAIEETLEREGADGAKKGKTKDTVNGDSSDFTLLSPLTIQALTRENPPIQLTVPPATAAAAVKARLETEARISADAKAAAAIADPSEPQTTAATTAMPSQHGLETHNTFAMPTKKAMVAQAALAQAAAASAIRDLRQSPVLSFAAQQQRAADVAHLSALQQQQHQQHQEYARHQNARQGEAAQAAAAAATLALVSSHQAVSRKGKSVGRKGKLHQGNGSGSSAGAAVALHLQQQAQQQPQTSSAFASLEEAVARLEAKRAEGASNLSSAATPMDVEKDQYASSVQISDGVTPLKGHESTNGQSHDQNGTTAEDGGAPSNGSHFANAHAQEAVSTLGDEDAAIEREDEVTRVHPSEVLALNKHASEVFMCAWNPVYTDLIATGSGDASARIWQMGGPDASSGCGPVRLLPHGTDPNDRKNKDVTTLEWSSDGKLLATGSYDGVARVWSRNGALVHTLARHRGPIFSLKWNRSGNFLLSGSYDQTTIVWDVSGPNGQVVQQFNDHEAPALDVDWKDDTTFASCSTDKRVLICRVGVERPLRVYTGHLDEVNAVKWDPSGTLLASCSDDYTAKVWNVTTDSTEPMYDFKSHKAEIYTVKWYVGPKQTFRSLLFPTIPSPLFSNLGVQQDLDR